MWSVYVGKLLSANRSTYNFSFRKKSLANHHMILLDYKRKKNTHMYWIALNIPKCFQDDPWLICARPNLIGFFAFINHFVPFYLRRSVFLDNERNHSAYIKIHERRSRISPIYDNNTLLILYAMMMMMCLEYITLLVYKNQFKITNIPCECARATHTSTSYFFFFIIWFCYTRAPCPLPYSNKNHHHHIYYFLFSFSNVCVLRAHETMLLYCQYTYIHVDWMYKYSILT